MKVSIKQKMFTKYTIWQSIYRISIPIDAIPIPESMNIGEDIRLREQFETKSSVEELSKSV